MCQVQGLGYINSEYFKELLPLQFCQQWLVLAGTSNGHEFCGHQFLNLT